MPDPPDPFLAVDGHVPLVLLPVRLETRVEQADDGQAALLVRVYPDALHVDSHDPRLTAREVRRGRRFWVDTWRAGDDEAAQRRAWRALADAFGSARATWVSRALAPLNPADRPREPLDPDADLPVEPEWPQPAQRGDDDTRPASATTLPARWLLDGSAGGRRVFRHWCREVPDSLQVGPDLAAGGLPDRPAADEGMAWMVDFDAAVEVGMAARVALPAEDLAALDTVLAVGVNDALDPGEAASRLAALLAAQHHTEGLELLPPGVPTNNTEEAASAYRSVDVDHARSFAAERCGPLAAEGDGSDGARVGHALGVGAGTFAHVTGADGRGDAEAAAMSTALWPVTWGYYLDQLLRTVSEEQAATARRLWVGHVRGRGPYPTLRAGRQPYGLLPVTSLQRWAPTGEAEDDDAPLVRLLRRAREVWQRSVERVPHVPTAERADLALLEVLSMQPASVRYAARHLLGPSYVRHLAHFLGHPVLEMWLTRQEELASEPLERLGIDAVPWLREGVWAPGTQAVDLPVVTEDEDEVPPSAGEPLDPNPLRWVLDHGYEEVRDPDPDELPSTLLGRLVRHSTLLAYALAARRVLAGRELPAARFEHELVGVHPGEATRTVWEDLAEVIPEVSGEQTLGAWLDGLDPADDPTGETAVAALGELRSALDALADVPPARLARLLPETLDCASHRFDAWVTALATRRLETVRTEAGEGIALGGYGWLTGSGLTRTGVEERAGGYVHAPSLGHAATAAVLRGGRETHREEADALCVDLSSRRSRRVQWLLDGVAQGQPLGALLGYRFERGLHEDHPDLELDRFVAPLRRLAPLTPGSGEAEGEEEGAEVSVAARDVVDGLALHRRRERRGIPYGNGGLPEPGSPEQAAVEAELDALDGLVDALGDATLAEAVHQLVQGNTARVHATLAALGHGDVPPPDLDVLRTPRTGTGLTHRVAVLLQDAEAPGDGWPEDPSPRAAAEPRLDAWVAALLGAPRQVRARAALADEDGEPSGSLREVSLRDLGMSPLDVLYAGAGDPLVELVDRVRHAVRRQEGAPDAVVTVRTGRGGGWPSEVLSFEEAAEVVRAAHAVTADGEALDERDLTPSPGGPPADADADDGTAQELVSRADAAVDALEATAKRLHRALGAADGGEGSDGSDDGGGESGGDDGGDDGDAVDADDLPDAVLAAAAFGPPGSVPVAAGVTDALVRQARTVAAELDRRQDRVAGLGESFDRDAATAQERREHDLARLGAVLGEGFRVLPLVAPPDLEALAATLADARPPRSDDPLAAGAWLQRTARVRPRTRDLADLLGYAEALGRTGWAQLRVGQLPVREGERWVGLPVPPDGDMPSGRLSLVAQAPGGAPRAEPLAGLVVDDWQEVVPHRAETTGVAFAYDQPDARAPHAVLLAAAPQPERGWSLDTVTGVLAETLELARLRAVDPDTLADAGHYLPAVTLAANVRGDTVSTRFDV